MGTRLLRDGRVVYESPPAPVRAFRGPEPIAIVPVGGRLSRGDLLHGAYSIEAFAAQHREGRLARVALQWADFEVQ